MRRALTAHFLHHTNTIPCFGVVGSHRICEGRPGVAVHHASTVVQEPINLGEPKLKSLFRDAAGLAFPAQDAAIERSLGINEHTLAQR